MVSRDSVTRMNEMLWRQLSETMGVNTSRRPIPFLILILQKNVLTITVGKKLECRQSKVSRLPDCQTSYRQVARHVIKAP